MESAMVGTWTMDKKNIELQNSLIFLKQVFEVFKQSTLKA
jgi:hypothetical protein